jgi:hypothetical protein
MSTEDRTERLEGSLWPEFRVQIVKDREVIQSFAVWGQSELKAVIACAKELQIKGQVHAEDRVGPGKPTMQEYAILFYIHV